MLRDRETRVMAYLKSKVAVVLRSIDFGSSVAESDHLLESARVETSVFTDLTQDRVDLIPGTRPYPSVISLVFTRCF